MNLTIVGNKVAINNNEYELPNEVISFMVNKILKMDNVIEENEELKKQQKEFIKYLEDEIEQNTLNVRWKHYNEEGFCGYIVGNPSYIESRPVNIILKEILQKYKEIIGDDKE